MTLRDEIHARQGCAELIAERDCEGIAAIMSAGRTKANQSNAQHRVVLHAATLKRA